MSIPAWIIALLALLFGMYGGHSKTLTSTKSATTTSAATTTTFSTTATGEACVLNEETGFCDVVTNNTGN